MMLPALNIYPMCLHLFCTGLGDTGMDTGEQQQRCLYHCPLTLSSAMLFRTTVKSPVLPLDKLRTTLHDFQESVIENYRFAGRWPADMLM